MILMIFQSIILAGQLWLTYYIHICSISGSKGYFMPLNDNLGLPSELEKRIMYRYDLTRAIPFQNRGDDMIKLLNTVIIVNNRTAESGNIPQNTLFTSDNSIFSRYGIIIPVSPIDLSKDTIEVKIEMKMKNSKNYTYRQLLYIVFSKVEEEKQWEIKKYNVEIKK